MALSTLWKNLNALWNGKEFLRFIVAYLLAVVAYAVFSLPFYLIQNLTLRVVLLTLFLAPLSFITILVVLKGSTVERAVVAVKRRLKNFYIQGWMAALLTTLLFVVGGLLLLALLAILYYGTASLSGWLRLAVFLLIGGPVAFLTLIFLISLSLGLQVQAARNALKNAPLLSLLGQLPSLLKERRKLLMSMLSLSVPHLLLVVILSLIVGVLYMVAKYPFLLTSLLLSVLILIIPAVFLYLYIYFRYLYLAIKAWVKG